MAPGLGKSSTTTLGKTFIKNDHNKEAIEYLDKDDCDENIGLEGLDEFSLSDIPEIPSPKLAGIEAKMKSSVGNERLMRSHIWMLVT